MNQGATNPLRVVKLLGRATIIQTPRLQNDSKGKDSPNNGPLRRINCSRFNKAPLIMNKTCKVLPIKAFDLKRDRDRHAVVKNTTERSCNLTNLTLERTMRVSQSVRILPKTETVFECNVEAGMKKIVRREEDTKMECPRVYKLVDGGIKRIIKLSNSEVNHQYIAKRSTMNVSQSQGKIDKKLIV